MTNVKYFASRAVPLGLILSYLLVVSKVSSEAVQDHFIGHNPELRTGDVAIKLPEVTIDIAEDNDGSAKEQKTELVETKLAPVQPYVEVDHSELLNSKRAKSNKIGFLLSKLHATSAMLNLRVSKQDLENHDIFEDKTVEALLTELCPPSLGLCARWINSQSGKEGNVLEKIAAKIRARPKGIDPRRYLWHLLLETGVGTMVEHNYDRHLDTVVNFVTTRHLPATLVPLVATDMYLKFKYDN